MEQQIKKILQNKYYKTLIPSTVIATSPLAMPNARNSLTYASGEAAFEYLCKEKKPRFKKIKTKNKKKIK